MKSGKLVWKSFLFYYGYVRVTDNVTLCTYYLSVEFCAPDIVFMVCTRSGIGDLFLVFTPADHAEIKCDPLACVIHAVISYTQNSHHISSYRNAAVQNVGTADP